MPVKKDAIQYKWPMIGQNNFNGKTYNGLLLLPFEDGEQVIMSFCMLGISFKGNIAMENFDFPNFLIWR